MSYFLSFLFALTQVSVQWSSPECRNPTLMGYFSTGTNTITVCKENAKSVNETLKHEYVHWVYDQKGPDFTPIPEPLLTDLTRVFLSSQETLTVILATQSYPSEEEFSARLISMLPDPLFVVWALCALAG